MRITLAELLEATHNELLDGEDNRLLIQRLPGDELRVNLARDHLVFSPGETWRIDVQPNLVEMAAGTSVRLRAQVMQAPEGRVRFRDATDLAVADDGTVPRKEGWEIPVPLEEGVYDLELSIEHLGMSQLFRGGSALRRKVQFVVVDTQPTKPDAENAWKRVLEFDASEPRWWDALMRLPAWSHMPISCAPRRSRWFGSRGSAPRAGRE